ncbi:recombinase family protein [Arthrobacter sp. PAMC25284]|nr:recombinase family protein [Arthrobacter sp. PAMC25284]
MGKLIGYARVSTRAQDADRQTVDLLAAGVRRDDLYTDHGVSGARAARPAFGAALAALHEGDTLVVTTLDRLGRSTANMLELATLLRERKTGLRVLNLGGGDVDTGTPMGSMVFTVMTALAQMELEIKRERITDSVSKRRAAGRDLGGRREQFTDSQINNARRLIDAGQPATQVARDLGMSRATLYRRMGELDARQWIIAQPPLNGTADSGTVAAATWPNLSRPSDLRAATTLLGTQ